MFAATVCGCRGRVDQWQPEPNAKRPNRLAVTDIQVIEDGHILLRRVRSGAEVENELDLSFVAFEPFGEGLPFHALRGLQSSVVLKLVGAAEIIDQHQVEKPRFVQPCGELAADESGRSRDHNHVGKGSANNLPYLCRIGMERKDLVYITRRARFNAAHKLWNPEWTPARNFEVFGKCAGENWHGHNFDVYVTLKGEIDPATGYFINFHDLKAIMKERIEEPLDHKNLNMDVPWLAGKQTSTEVLAMGIWREMEAGLAGHDCALHRVRVWETENNFADYFGGA